MYKQSIMGKKIELSFNSFNTSTEGFTLSSTLAKTTWFDLHVSNNSTLPLMKGPIV